MNGKRKNDKEEGFSDSKLVCFMSGAYCWEENDELILVLELGGSVGDFAIFIHLKCFFVFIYFV